MYMNSLPMIYVLDIKPHLHQVLPQKIFHFRKVKLPIILFRSVHFLIAQAMAC